MRSWWILIVWWGVAALSSAGHLVFFDLADSHNDFTWWGPIFAQFMICTAWALITPLAFRIARGLGEDVRPAETERRRSLDLLIEAPKRRREGSAEYNKLGGRMKYARPARIARVIAWGLMLSAAMSTSRALLHGFEHPAGIVCSPSFARIVDYMTLDLPLFAAVLSAGLAHRYLLQREAQQARAAAIEVQLAESRLHALQMQLNPHFLFNTLNTISALVESDPAATRTVVARLSELLRRTLDVAQQPEVRIADELQFIRGYLEIMQHRFSDRLTTSFAIEHGIDDALVPAFVLQPLVENAIEHGIGRIRGPGELELRIERRGDRLHIAVRDNGPGVDPAALPSGSAASPGSAGRGDPTARAGIGLSNTAARLAQLYPGKSALRLEDDGGRGAVAVVELPYRTLDDEAGA
jgi:signal transduction histidine kinase